MCTLREQGYRFMVRNDRQACGWVHPAEVRARVATWTDCTDMNDAEFEAFMTKGQPVAA